MCVRERAGIGNSYLEKRRTDLGHVKVGIELNGDALSNGVGAVVVRVLSVANASAWASVRLQLTGIVVNDQG